MLDKLLLLDIITSNSTRPIYFTSAQEPIGLGLDKYMKLDGCAYKLTPYQNLSPESGDIGFINTDQLYDQYMNKFEWKSLSDPRAYFDYFHLYTVATVGVRQKFCRLATALLNEGKTDKAIKVLDKVCDMTPNERVPFDYNNLNIAALYLQAGQKEKGNAMLNMMKTITHENATYFSSLSRKQLAGLDYENRLNLYLMQEIAQIEKNPKTVN